MTFTFMSFVYIVCFAGCCLNLVIFCSSGRRKMTNQLLTLVFAGVACGGYAIVAFCGGSIPVALTGNRVAYTGNNICMPLLVFTVADLCGVKINKWIRVVYVAFAASIVFCAYTVGMNDWYYIYDSIELVCIDGVYNIKTAFGPYHNALYVNFAVSILTMVCIFVHTIYKKKQVSYIILVTLIATVVVTVSIYVLQAVTGAELEYVPFGFFFTGMMFLIQSIRMERYNIANALSDFFMEREGYGFAVFDNKHRFVSCNEVMSTLVPAFATATVDRRIPTLGNEVLDELLNCFEEAEEEEAVERTFEVDEANYVAALRYYKDEKGDHVGYILELHDETERQNYIKQLQEAKEEADRASNVKTDFLSNMSHEMRTPLNAIIGMNEMLLRRLEDEELLSYAATVQHSSQNLLSLINDILDISKVESGKMELVCSDYELSSIMIDCYQMIESRASEKDLKLEVKVDKNLPRLIYGDPARVRQIFLNLLTNAVKYTKEGRITMSLSGDIVDNLLMLKFSVADTGIGMTPENITRLYEKFERFDMVNNKNIEGTGLGMPLTKQFIDMMNGTITVESTYGFGSTFTVVLPQQIRDAKPMGEVRLFAEADRTASSHGKGFVAPDARVLVVDDVPVNCSVFAALLSESQMQIDSAFSGLEAIEKACENYYDIIFMDHMMPEPDGMETYKRIMEHPDNRNSRTPVVMLTANAIVGMREVYLEHGFADYLTKPVQYQKLEDMIIGLLPPDKVKRNGVFI